MVEDCIIVGVSPYGPLVPSRSDVELEGVCRYLEYCLTLIIDHREQISLVYVGGGRTADGKIEADTVSSWLKKRLDSVEIQTLITADRKPKSTIGICYQLAKLMVERRRLGFGREELWVTSDLPRRLETICYLWWYRWWMEGDFSFRVFGFPRNDVTLRSTRWFQLIKLVGSFIITPCLMRRIIEWHR